MIFALGYERLEQAADGEKDCLHWWKGCFFTVRKQFAGREFAKEGKMHGTASMVLAEAMKNHKRIHTEIL